MTISNHYIVDLKHPDSAARLNQFLADQDESPARLIRISPHQNTYVMREHALQLQKRLNEAIHLFQQRVGCDGPTIVLRKPYQLTPRQQLTFLDLVVTIRPLMAGVSVETLASHITLGPSPESPLLVDGVSLYEFLTIETQAGLGLDDDNDTTGAVAVLDPASFDCDSNDNHQATDDDNAPGSRQPGAFASLMTDV